MAEIETGIRLGKNLISGGFQDFFMLSDSFSMVELAVPDSWINHNLEELNLRKKYEINVIAIKKGETICVNIHPEENLCMGEILILAGENKALAKLMKKYKENVVLYFGETPFSSMSGFFFYVSIMSESVLA